MPRLSLLVLRNEVCKTAEEQEEAGIWFGNVLPVVLAVKLLVFASCY